LSGAARGALWMLLFALMIVLANICVRAIGARVDLWQTNLAHSSSVWAGSRRCWRTPGPGPGARAGRASAVAPFEYAQFVFAPLAGPAPFGDLPSPLTLAGIALIVAGGVRRARAGSGSPADGDSRRP
jgi:drug/metabolite transporter (DMT)-like permease